MPARTRVKMIRNDLPKRGREIHRALERRVPIVARQMRDGLEEALQSGALPLQPDTGALGDGLALQTAHGDDYAQRRAQAKTAYLTSESRYKDAVRADVSKSAYTDEHFEQRAATETPALSQDEHTMRAAILSGLAWGYLWEHGHYNLFTGKEEHRPWFFPFLLDWWTQNASASFRGLAD